MPERAFPDLSGYPLTATADTPDFRDYIYEPALLELKSYIRRPPRLQILDQGEEGACTGFGLAAVINLQNDQRGRRYQVSARMLYEMARRFDEWPGETYDGSSCRGAIKGWHAMGVCREADWRYRAASPGELTIRRAKKARENTLGAYYRLRHRLADFHAALNEAGAIFVSADVHAGWDIKAVKNGTIPRREEKLGGHAFAIIGYNSKGFLVQNSWGRRWGSNGVALWSYEDWQDNIRDAWVFRLALPTPQIWHKPPNSYAARLDDMEQLGRSPSRGEIAGHFAHLDDGRLHGWGRYWSSLNDITQTAELVAASNKYDHLLIYAHGGLNSVTDSARRISAMKAVFKANRIYPFHIMYDTGLMEELKDVVLGRRQQAEARVGGFADWFDRLLERLTRKPGRALWREMKFGARSPFAPGADGEAVLRAFRAALVASGKAKKIHLVGHSTGGILMAYLLDALEALGPTQRVSSCSLMAPAGTLELFRSHYKPLLDPAAPFGIDQMTVYNLSDALERDDHVAGVYRKSLLYLVSHAFEEEAEAPLLGMQKHNAGLVEQVGPGALEFVYSTGAPGGRTAARSHGGFDNDPHTMNDILRRVLGTEPQRLFTAADLDY